MPNPSAPTSAFPTPTASSGSSDPATLDAALAQTRAMNRLRNLAEKAAKDAGLQVLRPVAQAYLAGLPVLDALVVQMSFRGLPVLADDLLTGALYDPRTGHCLSSSRLHLDVAKRGEVSQVKAQAWLRRRQNDLQAAKR
ncbi:MAG: hypothetical protein ACYCSR_11250 [Thiomonas sp.]